MGPDQLAAAQGIENNPPNNPRTAIATEGASRLQSSDLAPVPAKLSGWQGGSIGDD